MKYLVALIAGVIVGLGLFALFLLNNPFAQHIAISPLAVTQHSQIELSYDPVPTDSIAWVNNGQTGIPSFPDKVQDLWEATIGNSELLVTELKGSRGQPVGIGIKFTSMAEATGLLRGELPVNSVWQIWLREQRGLFVDQSENRWPYWRDVVLPARLSSADSWRGSWYGILTTGPGALGTGRITLAADGPQARHGEAVEALNAKAYSMETGPVSMQGHLTLALPAAADTP